MLKITLNKDHEELAKAELESVIPKFKKVNNEYIIEDKYESKVMKLAFIKSIKKNNRKIIPDKSFLKRRSHLLEHGNPAMTHPKIAKTMVNLSQAKRKITDPFVGCGGILIEAGLMGLNIEGYDIADYIVKKCELNLEEFGIKGRIHNKNALKINKKINHIVTDLPYGLSTKINQPLKELYKEFLFKLDKILAKKAVIGLADQVLSIRQIKNILKKTDLKIKHIFEWYLHKSLSKIILVLER